MVAPRKYPDELRERAIRLAIEARSDPSTRAGACKRIGEQLGINGETLRGWVAAAEAQSSPPVPPAPPSAQDLRIAELEKENRELRRSNEILRTASAFFASVPA